MQGAVNQQLYEFAARWQSAPHGAKGSIIDEAAQHLGLARATLHRRFKDMVATSTRKRRADAGTSALTRSEALHVASVLMEYMRKNGKFNGKIELAIDQLRANGLIRAERADPSTGEVVPLSTSSISRALRLYQVHPDQLLQPDPVMPLASLHPNHVWQIDASRCIMYYLPAAAADNGLRIMDEKAFYKNKPANLIKAMRESLWRYVVTDHCSGWLYATYVTGGETSPNLLDTLIGAMVQRPGHAMHGVPKMVMLDPGSANTSATFKSLCHALRIRVQINKPGNPRAKGSVEKAQDLVERDFEVLLKTLRPDECDTLEKINALCEKWVAYWNGTKIHSRHGMTRDAAWLRIAADQLVAAPPEDVMRLVAVSAPESRVVSPQLTVSFQGREYSVAAVPGVLVGERLLICRNAFDQDSAQAVGHTDDGYEVFHVLPQVAKDAWGQVVGAPIIGETYKRHSDTTAQANTKEIERLATGTDTDEAAAAARKQGRSFMGGSFNPLAHMEQTVLATPLPRRGSEHGLSAPVVHVPPLTHIEAAMAIKPRFPDWSAEHFQWLQANYPDGVPAEAVDAVAERLRDARRPQPAPARLVRVA
ncbi:transposase family protein [Alcaligenaceae bacterium]|nr:transposase family protein [Alcaligenaceae bacterium]